MKNNVYLYILGDGSCYISYQGAATDFNPERN